MISNFTVKAGRNQTTLQNFAEETYFGCPPFVNDSNPTWKEAADRLIYVANNFRQLDTGNVPTFGDIGAIFRKSYVKDMVLMAPIDTGLYEMFCYTHKTNATKLDCKAWNPATIGVGTLDHFDHIIIPNLGLCTAMANTTIAQEAVKLFSRNSAFAGDYLKLPAVNDDDAFKYYETDIFGNPRFPDGVSFLIGNFHTLFGTDGGKHLQLLAEQYSWPLVWGLGGMPSDSQTTKSSMLKSLQQGLDTPTSWAGNQRVLDPIAIASDALNTTISISSKEAFTTVWTEVANRRKGPSPITPSESSTWWAVLASSQIRLTPLTARSGCSEDLCVGSNAESGECICKQPKIVVV